MGKNRAGLMAQVLTRTWPLANENLETVSKTSTPFSGDEMHWLLVDQSNEKVETDDY